ncbi:MAG: BamA/TamA family outer membrane protein [Myxococcota bacterium]
MRRSGARQGTAWLAALGMCLVLVAPTRAQTEPPLELEHTPDDEAAPEPMPPAEGAELTPQQAERRGRLRRRLMPGGRPGVRSDEDDDFEWLLLPLVGYSSDVGFGAAVLGLFFRYDDEHRPYRDRVQLISSITSELVQYHSITWERVGVFGWPLRVETQLSYQGTKVGHYCGLGNGVTCGRAEAEAAADDQAIVDPAARERFVDRYYRFRLQRPQGRIQFRWQPRRKGAELAFSWLGGYTFPGFIGAQGVYRGSLYAQNFPDGERGFQSELRVGVVLDRRDDERRPSEGYVAAITLRGAHRASGSEWNYGGVSLAGSAYQALDRGRRAILAVRAVMDVLVGDAPTIVLGSVGGFWSSPAYGGQFFGRGIRQRRYLGAVKGIGQAELRWAFWGEPSRFQLAFQGFADVGWVGYDVRDFGGPSQGSLGQVLVGFGGGIGANWGRQFVLRGDVGLSSLEEWNPQIYVQLTHPF